MDFPLYILRLDGEWIVVFPKDRFDLGHTEFWAKVVAQIVAAHYQISVTKLANLPYCQRRARIVGDRVYYGEKQDRTLLQLIRKAVANRKLAFAFDGNSHSLLMTTRNGCAWM